VCAPQRSPNPAAELADRERLRDVVVRPELEPDDLVELVVAGRQHDDRDRAPGAQAAAHFQPVQLREHDVEDHEVDVVLIEAGESLLSVPGLDDPKALPLEREREHLLHRFLVVDEQDGRVLSHRDKG
jgi:hypothetical protein